MTKAISVKGAARDAVRKDISLRKQATPKGDPQLEGVSTVDSFVNFAHKLGIGADNPLTSSSYGFNPITRNRILLEWIHRGSWLGGVAVDVVADDMTRQGIEFLSEMEPEEQEKITQCATQQGVWNSINETIKWGRLYGGAVGVILLDGQDLRQPLRIETVGPGQFKGILPLDRWMVDPTLEDLVTEYGPSLGLPKYYRVQSNAPALRGQSVHYTRCVVRHEGVKLPYQQRLTENLWGISVLERLYDRMIAFDSASTGMAQLIYKAYLRTLSIKGMRELVSSGSKPALDGLVKYTDMMRRFQGIEGITLIDGDDKFEAQSHSAFSGLSGAVDSLAMQLSGALQIPLTRLFGQSPAGLNATGDNDVRNYFDHIKQRQESDLHRGVTTTYQCIAKSESVDLDDGFALGFRSLWQLTDTDKANINKTTTDSVIAAKDANLITDQVAMKEMRQSSRITGVWTNITTEMIEQADDELAPDPVELMGSGVDPETGLPIEGPGEAPTDPTQKEKQDGSNAGSEAGSQEKASPVAKSSRLRKSVSQAA